MTFPFGDLNKEEKSNAKLISKNEKLLKKVNEDIEATIKNMKLDGKVVKIYANEVMKNLREENYVSIIIICTPQMTLSLSYLIKDYE
jgi:glyceraldehyde-3-phosphate dehydrogenase/erythrose-4-phosphate dehydrogenase